MLQFDKVLTYGDYNCTYRLNYKIVSLLKNDCQFYANNNLRFIVFVSE